MFNVACLGTRRLAFLGCKQCKSIFAVYEIGHAALSYRMGYQVLALRVFLIHRVYEYQAPQSFKKSQNKLKSLRIH